MNKHFEGSCELLRYFWLWQEFKKCWCLFVGWFGHSFFRSSVCWFIHPFVSLFVSLLICFFSCLSVRLSVCLLIHLFVCLFVHMFVHPFVHLFVGSNLSRVINLHQSESYRCAENQLKVQVYGQPVKSTLAQALALAHRIVPILSTSGRQHYPGRLGRYFNFVQWQSLG